MIKLTFKPGESENTFFARVAFPRELVQELRGHRKLEPTTV